MNGNLLIKIFTECSEIHKKCIFAAQSTTIKKVWHTKLVKIFAPLAEPASANALKRLSLKALLTPSTLISASNAVLALTFVRAKLSAWSSQNFCLTTKKRGSDFPGLFWLLAFGCYKRNCAAKNTIAHANVAPMIPRPVLSNFNFNR